MADSIPSVPPPTGLTEAEVQQRRGQGQGNVPPPATGRTYEQIAKENVFTTINIVIFTLGVALALVGRMGDAVVSLLVISSNIVVGLLQEVRAKRKLDQITLLTRPTATVIRDGQEVSVPQEDLVLGDVLKLTPGDQVMLDGEVLQSRNMTVDESLLTGESDPIPKLPGAPIFSGSYCVAGGGYYQATKVGKDSLSGQIVASAKAFKTHADPAAEPDRTASCKVLLVCVIYLEFLILLNALHAQTGRARHDRQRHAGRRPGAQRPLSVDVGGLCAGSSAHAEIRHPRPAGQRRGIAEQRGRVVHGQDRHLDDEPPAGARRLPRGGDRGEACSRSWGGWRPAPAQSNPTSAAIAAAFPAPAEAPVAEVPFSSARKWSAVALAQAGSTRWAHRRCCAPI